MNTSMDISEAKQRLDAFFFVYFDPKIAKNVQRHPEVAIPILRDAIKQGLPTRERLGVYSRALSDAVAIQSLGTSKKRNGAMS